MSELTNLAQNLSYALRITGTTQRKLANSLCPAVTDTTVYFWCKGEKMPRKKKLVKIADYFGVSVDEIVGDPASFKEKDEYIVTFVEGERSKKETVSENDIFHSLSENIRKERFNMSDLNKKVCIICDDITFGRLIDICKEEHGEPSKLAAYLNGDYEMTFENAITSGNPLFSRIFSFLTNLQHEYLNNLNHVTAYKDPKQFAYAAIWRRNGHVDLFKYGNTKDKYYLLTTVGGPTDVDTEKTYELAKLLLPKPKEKKKYVINNCFGSYSLSREAYDYLGLEWDEKGTAFEEDRANPELIKCVEKLGEKANGQYASLKIVEVPADAKVAVTGYDGLERITEEHRVWY